MPVLQFPSTTKPGQLEKVEYELRINDILLQVASYSNFYYAIHNQ